MRYLALATDYDETIAVEGRLSPDVISALERLRSSGRKAILVTGRKVDDLVTACPRLDLFDCVVAENGAVLHWPAARETTVVCEPVPPRFVEALRVRGIPHSVGQVIVSSRHPHESAMLEIIRELGTELQIVFNGDAVMILPPGVNKGSGLEKALRRMGLSPHEVVGVGNASNDHSFLALSECAVAVANAIPALKARAAFVTAGGAGDGVVELIDELVRDDLRAPRRGRAAARSMEPLAPLFDEAGGEPLPLPPALLAFYGPLRMTSRPDRPHVFANFVASVDGIVAVDPPRGSGAEISGGNAHDRAVMGLLRALADGVVIGAGNLRAEGDHVWTAGRICPELAGPYAQLRAALGKTSAPLQIVVSGSGNVDLSRAVFSGAAPSIVVTSDAGAARLRAQRSMVRIAVPAPGAGWISLAAVLEAAELGPGALVLLESGPTSTTGFLAEGAVDEIFLTIAPIFVGRTGEPPTLGLLERGFFPPGTLRGRLLSARRSESFVFLRYAISRPRIPGTRSVPHESPRR